MDSSKPSMVDLGWILMALGRKTITSKQDALQNGKHLHFRMCKTTPQNILK